MIRSYVQWGLVAGLAIAAGCSSSEAKNREAKTEPPAAKTPPLLNTNASTGAAATPAPPPLVTPTPQPAAQPVASPTNPEANLVPLAGAPPAASTTPAQPVAATQPPAVTQPIIADQPISMPPRQPELISAEPSPEYVWIPGNWERTADQWQWVPGQWKQAPFNHARWVNGYWKYQTGQYVWNPGHWAVAEPGRGMVVDKPVAPPPLPVESTASEVVQPPPSPSHRWVPGHWDWVNGWWWFVPGHFTLVPDPQAVWVPGQWKQGLLGQWRWIAGHWELKAGL